MSRNMLLSDQILDSLDTSSKEDCLSAKNKLIYQYGIYKKRNDRAHAEADGLICEFSDHLEAGNKALQAINKCYEKNQS